MSKKLKAYMRTPGSMVMMLLVMLSAVFTFAVLIFLIAYVLIHGVPYLKPSLFSFTYSSENASLMPALINTVIMTVLSLLIAVPFGVFSAICLVEYAKRGNKFAEVIRLSYMVCSECCFSCQPVDGAFPYWQVHLPWQSWCCR